MNRSLKDFVLSFLIAFLIVPPISAGPYPGTISNHGHSASGDGGVIGSIDVTTRVSVGKSTMTVNEVRSPNGNFDVLGATTVTAGSSLAIGNSTMNAQGVTIGDGVNRTVIQSSFTIKTGANSSAIDTSTGTTTPILKAKERIGVGVEPDRDFIVQKTTNNIQVFMSVDNEGTGADSHAVIQALTGSPSGGNPQTKYQVGGGGQNWTTGIEQGNASKYVISNAANFSRAAIAIDTTGRTTFLNTTGSTLAVISPTAGQTYLPGAIVQISTSAPVSISSQTVSAAANTSINVTITPKFANSAIRAVMHAYTTCNIGGVSVQLGRNGTAVGRTFVPNTCASAGFITTSTRTFTIEEWDKPGVTTPVTYSIMFGANSGIGQALLGLGQPAWIDVTEYAQ